MHRSSCAGDAAQRRCGSRTIPLLVSRLLSLFHMMLPWIFSCLLWPRPIVHISGVPAHEGFSCSRHVRSRPGAPGITVVGGTRSAIRLSAFHVAVCPPKQRCNFMSDEIWRSGQLGAHTSHQQSPPAQTASLGRSQDLALTTARCTSWRLLARTEPPSTL